MWSARDFCVYFPYQQPSYLQKFVAVADYEPVDDVEMGLREDDVVEMLSTGTTGCPSLDNKWGRLGAIYIHIVTQCLTQGQGR